MIDAHSRPLFVTNSSSLPVRAISMARASGWRNVLLWLLALGVVAGCSDQADGGGDAESPKPARDMTMSSRDGVLSVTLPADLHVHRHSDAVQGVSADGRFRVHVEHRPQEMLMKMVGRTKEVLRKRTWDITREKHYRHAIELRLKRGGVSGKIPEVRTIWWVTANGRVLSCDGVAHAEQAKRLGGGFRALCQGAKLVPPPPPPPPVPGPDAVTPADGADAPAAAPAPTR